MSSSVPNVPPCWSGASPEAPFALSLALRTLDRDVCDYVPVGTHFLWHLLTGLVLYLVSRTMIRKNRP